MRVLQVNPIKNIGDIEKVKRHLIKNNKLRDYCLFVVGINIGLRISDLLKLRIKDVWLQDEIRIVEQKTNKTRAIKLNAACRDAVNVYLNSSQEFAEEDFLFKSRKGDAAINKSSAHKLINSWCDACRIKGNFGTHSLRKTFAYHLYMNNAANPQILPYLMRILNHSSQSITLCYIGLEQETVNNFYDELNL